MAFLNLIDVNLLNTMLEEALNTDLPDDLWYHTSSFLKPLEVKYLFMVCKRLNTLMTKDLIDKLANKYDTLMKWFPSLFYIDERSIKSISYTKILELVSLGKKHLTRLPFYKRDDLGYDFMIKYKEASSKDVYETTYWCKWFKYLPKFKTSYEQLIDYMSDFKDDTEWARMNPAMSSFIMDKLIHYDEYVEINTDMDIYNPGLDPNVLISLCKEGQLSWIDIYDSPNITIEHVRDNTDEERVRLWVLRKKGLIDSDIDVLFSYLCKPLCKGKFTFTDCSNLSLDCIDKLFKYYGNCKIRLYKAYWASNISLDLILDDLEKPEIIKRKHIKSLLKERVLDSAGIKTLWDARSRYGPVYGRTFWEYVSLNPCISFELIKANMGYPWDIISLGVNPSIKLSEVVEYLKMRGFSL